MSKKVIFVELDEKLVNKVNRYCKKYGLTKVRAVELGFNLLLKHEPTTVMVKSDNSNSK